MTEKKEIRDFDPIVNSAQLAAFKASAFLMELRTRGIMNINPSLDAGFYDDKEATGGSAEIISEFIHSRFKNHTIICDRKTVYSGDAAHVWRVDPIDGTIRFVRKIGGWGVSIGYFRDGLPNTFVGRFPVEDETYTAVAGGGAFVNGEQVQVSNERNLKNAVVFVDFGDPENTRQALKIMSLLRPRVRQVLSEACSTESLASVAKGGAVASIHRAYSQDLLAGLMITEAGGEVTHQNGDPITAEDWWKEKIDWIASNRLVHPQIVEIINQ